MAGDGVSLGPSVWWPGSPAPAGPGATLGPGILLDRDGTLNVERHHLADPELLEPLPGARDAVAAAALAGLRIAVVTNQSVIGRGIVTEADMATIHGRLHELFPQVEVIVHCPHHPDAGCPCRKPKPLMLAEAMRLLAIDPARCAYVGDHRKDVEAARAAGLTAYLVRTGHGGDHVAAATDAGATVVDDVSVAIRAHLEAV